MNQIISMLKLQKKLNDETNGVQWYDGVTKQGKIIDWKRCIFLEAAELIDSYPWKHWKSIDAKVDFENIKIELVDIWHFVMSEALKVAKEQGIALEKLAKEIEAIVKSINVKVIEKEQIYEQVEAIEAFVKELLCNFELFAFIRNFFILCAKLDLDFDELYRLYLGKNVLNKFRQDYGYKEGTYNKIWNGKEDNLIMQEILEKEDIKDFDELYQKLLKIYQNI